MPRGPFKSVTIEEDKYNVLQRLAKKKGVPMPSIVHILLHDAVGSKVPKRFKISHAGGIYVIDTWGGPIAEIVEGKNLFCKYCKRENCIHIGALIGMDHKYNTMEKI